MNGQPVVIGGYYMHYKKKVYRLLKFASTDNPSEKHPFNEDIVIYQPQYPKQNIPDDTLWVRPTKMFFENIATHTPRFRYIGKNEEEVMQIINQHKLGINPEFKKQSMLSESKAELVFMQYAIKGFAIHSETLDTIVLYYKNGLNRLLALPEKEFFEAAKSFVTPSNDILSKYIKELDDAKKFL